MADRWRHCLGLIRLHYPIGEVYQELAGGAAQQDLKALAVLVGSSVRTGANLPQVFAQSAAGLREQLESKEQLESQLAARRLEGYLLAAAPAAYTALLRLAASAYMEPLYTGYGWLTALAVFGMQLGGCHLFFQMLLREEAGPPLMELADFQEEVALHLRAGLSLPDAWRQAARHRAGDEASKHDKDEGMASQLGFVARQTAMGIPFGAALERLSQKGGGSTELGRMAELLRQNYQLGGGSLAALLSLEAKETRRKCLLDRQAKDGKRGTLLLFPMILLLLSALLLTAGPALLSV